MLEDPSGPSAEPFGWRLGLSANEERTEEQGDDCGKSGMGAEARFTIVVTEEEVENRLQAKNTQEVPADARHPPGVHVFGGDTSLEHALELDG